MPIISLPDGKTKSFPQPVTVLAVAESIGRRLAADAVIGYVDGQMVDVSHTIEQNASVEIITVKDPRSLETIRHSTAHLLAHAVKRLFPTAQVTIGPVIEDGFYYDFAFDRGFTPEDLEKIEATMHEIAKADLSVHRRSIGHDEAIDLFSELGEHYKVEIINDIPRDEKLTIYEQGDFIDLCRGPHVPHTGILKVFKLTKLAGAYWRGDSRNAMLQRIYGTAWLDKPQLEEYLKRLEEAKHRDHRELAKKMDLFHIQPEAPGSVFWHGNGWQLNCTIRDYIRQVLAKAEYIEVNTPQLVDDILWQQSGHKAKFADDMFEFSAEGREYLLKPMNCPCHVQLFKQGLRSYRDLPLRLAEFGSCHRNEPSGTLHGLMRLRNFVQDDAHIFCSENQIHSEVLAFIDQLHQVYEDFGFNRSQMIYRLSTRPEQRVGSDEVWDKAEHALADALNIRQLTWELLPGEGAFYGPKIEFSLRDCLGRIWQCGTMQVDFSTAERLGAFYIAEDGSKRPPVMLHRAYLGSLERFIGILIEHYAGHLPLWLAPVQVVVMGIADRHHMMVTNIVEKLQKLGIRVHSDLRNEKIGFKIREHTIARVPYQIVIGDREVADATLTVRSMHSEQPETMTYSSLSERLLKEIASKTVNQSGGP